MVVSGTRPRDFGGAVKAVLLAGGLGSRLRPYTWVLPKPLIPVGDQPVIALLLKQLRKHGVEEAIITLGYLGELIQAACADGAQWGIRLKYVNEEKPLGTIGPLSYLREHLTETFLVSNGDVVADINIHDLVDFHHQKGGIATVACYKKRYSVDYGILTMDDSGHVRSFEEKPVEDVMVNMGIYVFEPSILRYIPHGESSGVDKLLHELLRNQEEVHCFVHDGQWLDIGSVKELEEAQEVFRSCRDRILGD